MASDNTSDDVWTMYLKDALTYWIYHAFRLTESKKNYCVLAGVEQLKKILEICTIFDIDLPVLSKIQTNNILGRYNQGMNRNYRFRISQANKWLEESKGVSVNGKNITKLKDLGFVNDSLDIDEEEE